MNKKGQVSLNQVPAVAWIFLLTGIFFAVSIVILSAFQTASISTVTITNEEFTMPAINGTITTSHLYLVAITSVANTTTTYPAANYTITDANAGTVMFYENATVCKTGAMCNISYTYNTYAEADASVSLTNSITAMSEIPSNWLTIIAVILAASIIIVIVINNLGGMTGGSRRQ